MIALRPRGSAVGRAEEPTYRATCRRFLTGYLLETQQTRWDRSQWDVVVVDR